jgi:hypothetical protein
MGIRDKPLDNALLTGLQKKSASPTRRKGAIITGDKLLARSRVIVPIPGIRRCSNAPESAHSPKPTQMTLLAHR